MIGGTWIRKTRKQHQCSEQSYHTIKPGDLYLSAVAPPWHDMNTSGKWWVIKACLRCADHSGLHTSDTRKKLESNGV